MSKCNLLKPLSNNNGNFFMFSQYSDDLTKEYTQKDQYRVIPSKFVAMNIDAQKFDNNSIAKVFQNYYENACSFFRTELVGEEEQWNPRLAGSLLWQTMIREGLISVEDTTPIKYIGDINIYSTQEIDGTSYNEIYCYIGNDVVDKKYKVSYENKKFYSCNSSCICGFENEYDSLGKDSNTEYINGLPLGPVYDSQNGTSGYFLYDYVLDTEGESLGDEYNRLATSFDINTIVVLYDIENVEGGKHNPPLYSNIPMGIYFTGKIEQGEIKNGIKKYVQNAEVYGQGTSYGLRICTRYLSYPNAVMFQDTIAVDTDEQEENMTSLLSKMNDSQIMMREALNRVVENSSNLKNHYNQFKGNLVNVPYIQTVGGVSYWFVNGRNTEAKVLDIDDIEINIQEINEDDINLIFKSHQVIDTEDESMVITDAEVNELFDNRN